MDSMNIAVILPAAGVGKRFGGASKLEQDLVGRPVFLRSVELFLNQPHIGRIILAVNPDAIDDFRFRWGDKLAFHGIRIVPGGRAERWETVLNALREVDDTFTHVAVHDAARPLASRQLIDRVIEAGRRHAAVIPAVAVNGTLKRVADVEKPQQPVDPLDAILGEPASNAPTVRKVVQTVDRRNVVEVQTPQLFERALLVRAYEQITAGRIDPANITDDAGLVEALGEPVYVVDGEVTNLKITRPDDLKLAQAIYQFQHKDDAASLARKRLFADEDE